MEKAESLLELQKHKGRLVEVESESKFLELQVDVFNKIFQNDKEARLHFYFLNYENPKELPMQWTTASVDSDV